MHPLRNGDVYEFPLWLPSKKFQDIREAKGARKLRKHKRIGYRSSFLRKFLLQEFSIFERFLHSSRMSFSYTHWRIFAKQQIYDYVRHGFYCGGFHLGSIYNITMCLFYGLYFFYSQNYVLH